MTAAGAGKIETAEVGLLTYRLARPMGGSGVSEVDLILCRLSDGEGAEGLGFSYVIAGGGRFVAERAAALAGRFLAGRPLHPPPAHWREVAASFNRTGGGPNLVALAALDLALWDLEARRRGVPLAVVLGGRARAVPVYASGGFAPGMAPAAAAELAAERIAAGMAGVKPRISGHPKDLALLDAVARVAEGKAWLMADMNEKGDATRARWMLSAARERGLLFVEEPLPAADREGLAALSRGAPVTIATGEHLQGLGAFAELASGRVAGVLQPDLAMVGGMTPCLAVARLAEAHGLQVMPHFLPGLFVHLAAASPAVTMLEEFPLLEPLFNGMPDVTAGQATPGAAAGHGLSLAGRHAADVAWLRA